MHFQLNVFLSSVQPFFVNEDWNVFSCSRSIPFAWIFISIFVSFVVSVVALCSVFIDKEQLVYWWLFHNVHLNGFFSHFCVCFFFHRIIRNSTGCLNMCWMCNHDFKCQLNCFCLFAHDQSEITKYSNCLHSGYQRKNINWRKMSQ